MLGDLDEPDPEVNEAAEGVTREPTSHLRSREEYLRGMRETWERWLPDVPVPTEWRETDEDATVVDAAPIAHAAPTPGSASNTSELGSDFEDRWAEPRRHQDRVRHRAAPEAPHSFRSRSPVEKQPCDGYAIGIGYMVLTLRELNGFSQRVLARHAGTSQAAITRIETGAHTPSLPTVLRLAHAGGYRVVLGFASPEIAAADPATLVLEDLALVGLLVPDPMDDLPNFRVIREPPPWAGRDG
jgi:transcriptional regulator with XRE-family HTH domain